MKKLTKDINVVYRFDPTHKGANYTFDGIHWTNNGEFAEIITKAVLGLDAKKDANTAYNVASDIPEMNASVKSSRFTLVNMKLADTFEETLKIYFETVHSTMWIYTVVIDNTANLYMMNREEFEEFLNNFSSLNERQLVRCKATSGKMITWLENRLN